MKAYLESTRSIVKVHKDVNIEVDEKRQPSHARAGAELVPHKSEGGGVVVHVEEWSGFIAKGQEKSVEELDRLEKVRYI